jgi:hypothetical protein
MTNGECADAGYRVEAVSIPADDLATEEGVAFTY